MNTHATRQPLEHYLQLQYRLSVIPDPEGGFFVEYPDLPGCMSQIERLEELPAVAEEIRALWITAAYEAGQEIPEPVYPEEYSGKFNVRLSRSLHRRLAERAAEEGVSLNQLVVALLAEGLGKRNTESAVLEDIRRIVGEALASQRHGPATGQREGEDPAWHPARDGNIINFPATPRVPASIRNRALVMPSEQAQWRSMPREACARAHDGEPLREMALG